MRILTAILMCDRRKLGIAPDTHNLNFLYLKQLQYSGFEKFVTEIVTVFREQNQIQRFLSYLTEIMSNYNCHSFTVLCCNQNLSQLWI